MTREETREGSCGPQPAFRWLLHDRFTAWRRPREAQGGRERAASSSGSGGRMTAGEASSTALTCSQGCRLTLPTPWGEEGREGGDRGIPRQGQKPLSVPWFCCRHTV